MKRHEAREKAIQTLFQIELSKLEVDEAIEFALDGEESDPFYEQLVTGTLEHIEDIDALLVENLKNWRLDRLGNVERTILRMATFELLYVETIPENVTINEAVELAKSFADEEAGKLVNGVLGNIIKEDKKNRDKTPDQLQKNLKTTGDERDGSSDRRETSGSIISRNVKRTCGSTSRTWHRTETESRVDWG